MENFKENVLKKANEIVKGEPFTDFVEVKTAHRFLTDTIYCNDKFSVCKSVWTESFYVYDFVDNRFLKLI